MVIKKGSRDFVSLFYFYTSSSLQGRSLGKYFSTQLVSSANTNVLPRRTAINVSNLSITVLSFNGNYFNAPTIFASLFIVSFILKFTRIFYIFFDLHFVPPLLLPPPSLRRRHALVLGRLLFGALEAPKFNHFLGETASLPRAASAMHCKRGGFLVKSVFINV
jgi:hypothetical protein